MTSKNVDILVGAQYGDEGKGMVCKLLADRAHEAGQPYQWTERVGAQNAEHRFIHQSCDFCARVFPAAAAFRDIDVVLGAGHCFLPEHFFKEAVHLGIDLNRVWVDKQAMWLTPEHALANRAIGDARGTTGWGIGAAIAEKVRRAPTTRLMGDCPSMIAALGSRLGTSSKVVNAWEGPGLIEGSQGAMLSLNHGHYPWCTAKDVTAPALLAETGIGIRRARTIFGVCRLVFMRVPGPSGPAGGVEVSYSEVEARTGLRLPQHKRLQGDAMLWKAGHGAETGEERLFDVSMEELRYSKQLNNFDYLVVTFADYHRPGNYRVRSWDLLHEDTRKLINRISDEIAPVCLIRTGQGENDNIWRIDPFNDR